MEGKRESTARELGTPRELGLFPLEGQMGVSIDGALLLENPAQTNRASGPSSIGERSVTR